MNTTIGLVVIVPIAVLLYLPVVGRKVARGICQYWGGRIFHQDKSAKTLASIQALMSEDRASASPFKSPMLKYYERVYFKRVRNIFQTP